MHDMDVRPAHLAVEAPNGGQKLLMNPTLKRNSGRLRISLT